MNLFESNDLFRRKIIYVQASKYYIGLKNKIENMYITIFDKGGHFLRL